MSLFGAVGCCPSLYLAVARLSAVATLIMFPAVRLFSYLLLPYVFSPASSSSRPVHRSFPLLSLSLSLSLPPPISRARLRGLLLLLSLFFSKARDFLARKLFSPATNSSVSAVLVWNSLSQYGTTFSSPTKRLLPFQDNRTDRTGQNRAERNAHISRTRAMASPTNLSFPKVNCLANVYATILETVSN